MTPEKRSSLRQRTFLGARICFNERRATLDCIVRNLSEGGALIEVSDTVAIPQSFELDIPNRNRTYRARACWRSASRIGVAFEDQDQRIDAPLDLARKLHTLEQDNQRLTSRIRQLTEEG